MVCTWDMTVSALQAHLMTFSAFVLPVLPSSAPATILAPHCIFACNPVIMLHMCSSPALHSASNCLCHGLHYFLGRNSAEQCRCNACMCKPLFHTHPAVHWSSTKQESCCKHMLTYDDVPLEFICFLLDFLHPHVNLLHQCPDVIDILVSTGLGLHRQPPSSTPAHYLAPQCS